MKKMLRMLVALANFGGLAHGTIFIETGFEGSTSLPAGWTQSTVSGSATWNVQQGGGAGGTNPTTARSGTNNATLYVGNTGENKTRLASPAFDTVGYTNLSLTFWHTQALWSPDQDQLKVFFSSDGGTNWTELAYYTTSVSAWTQRTLVIPSASANSRIAFEGNAKYGYGVCLDDIQVTGIPGSISEVSVSATDASASEVGPDPGTWTITRIGNTTGAVSVNFTLSGTATISSDYNVTPASPINFAAGETSKVVTLTPVDDVVGAEGNEVATLTLTAGTGYAIGTASGSISIYDDEGYDLNILVIGSTHSFSEGGESGVVHEKPFNPTTIASHLYQIIDQDPAISGSVNVQFEDIYKTKAQTVNYSGTSVLDFTSRCYSLAQHYLWPDGKTNRLANLRGQAGTQWDYIIICNDPYIMANFPGMVAEGVKLIKEEVAKSLNPAQVVLLAQWPESNSTFTATQFNEIAYRVGNSASLTVVPAGKAWDGYGSKDTSSNHPTPRGEYLAAASIYSKLYNRSAKTSAYVYPTVGSAIADHALSVVQANNGVAQYSGSYTSFNPFQMKYLAKRVVSYRETGTSTEDRMSQALDRLDDVQRITFNTSGYAGTPGTRWDFNYGRGNDRWEDDKDYEVNSTIYDWVYGFPMHHYSTTSAPNTMPYGIDKHYENGTTYEDGTDLGIPYNMIRPNTREPDWPEAVRAIPIRLMWQKMCEVSPGFNPLGDSTHMNPNLNDASAAFMYTLLSGRCPIVAEPTPQGSTNPAWMQWLGHKTGYETAWQMSHLTTRAPGFRILPSTAVATTVTPTTTETMTVQFTYQPQANVTVTVSSSSPTAAIVSPKTLVFTPSNYNTPQQVKVAGIPGATASPTFNVNFSTSSTDEIYNGLSDSWAYTNNRAATSGLTQVDNGTSQVTVDQYVTKAINLGVAAANAGNTIFAGPHNGSITWQGNGVILYTPTGNYLGTDQIVFAVTNGTAQTIGCVDITVAVPEGQVNVSATDAAASETVPNPGIFVISRVGSTTSPINVIFSLSGTATLGSDYTLSHTSPVTIPAGQGSITLTLSPVDDSTFGEGNETAILTINSDPAYSIGLAAATITIADNDNNAPVVNAGSDQTVTLGASVPWSPTVLAPQLWLDASTATDNAGTVSIVNGGSGGGTVSGPAALAAGGIGTLQAVQFNGGGKYLTGDYINTGTTLSAFFVGKSLNATQTAYAGMMSVWTNGQANDWNNAGSSVLFNQNNTTANSVQTYRNAALSSTTGTLTAGFLAGTVFDGATNTAYLNGTPATNVASSGAFNAGKVVLGARWHTSVFNYSWNGNFGEAIVCNANLSTTDRQNVEGYLAHKWGLAGSLAVGHPHKDMPPGGSGAVATLDASVTDADGQTPITLWTKVTGPGTVTFSNASAIDTTATFAVAGVYTLRLTANDGFGAVSDDIVITVSSGNAVTYNGNGGTGSVPVDASSPYTSGSTVTVLDNTGTLVRTGYTFNGWNTQADGLGTSYAPGVTFTISSTTTLYAKWTINSYTITFDSAGGSAVTAITQNYGTTVTAPTDPTRNGYTFAGWSPSLPATIPNNNLTVTAQWTTSNYAVTYSGNGSTGGAVPIDIIGPYTNGSTVTVLNNTGTLVRTGYTFNGWNTQADGFGTSYAPAATFTISTTTMLYAKWTINSYTITFDSAGGSAATAITQNYGTTVNAPANPTRSGYTFTGWSPSLPATMPGNNLTVTAQWTITTYTVTYNGNGNTGGTAPADQIKTHDIALNLASNTGTLARTGYTFAGWNTQADGLGTSYAVEAAYATNSTLALYSKWTANIYTVTFDANGGDAPSPSSNSVTFGSTYGTLATTSRAGYTFNGWFTATSGGTAVTSSTTVTNAENHTLYAQWTASSYTITFDANGGDTASPTSKSVTYGSTYGTLATTSRAGYTFNGWFTATSSGTQIASGTTVAITSAQTLYAQWTVGVLLTWDANGTGTDQTNGAGAWGTANLWWNGMTNISWQSGASAKFGGPNTAGGAVTLAAPTTVENFTFNLFTGTYTLGTAGQTITLNSGIIKNTGSAAVTFVSPITLGAAQTWTNNFTGLLKTGNGTLLTNGGFQLTIDGTGDTEIGQLNVATATLSGFGALVKNGTGVLFLGGNNSAGFSGDVTLNGGMLNYGDVPTSLGTGNLEITNGILQSRWSTGKTWAQGTTAGAIQITGGVSGFASGNGATFDIGAVTWGSSTFNPTKFAFNHATSASGAVVKFSSAINLSGATRTITVDGGVAGTARAELTGVISGTGASGLTKEGTGILLLTTNAATSSWNGNTTISGGLLHLGAANLANIGGGSGRNISVAAGAGVGFNGLSNAILNRIVETTAEISVMTGTTSNAFDFSSNTGATLPNAFLGTYSSNGGKCELSGVITPGGGSYRLGAPGGLNNGALGITQASLLSGANGLAIGGNRVVIVGTHTFTGDTTLRDGAILGLSGLDTDAGAAKNNSLALQNSVLDLGAPSSTGLIFLEAGNAGGITGLTTSANGGTQSATFGGLKGSRNLYSAFKFTSPGNNTSAQAATAITGFTLNPGSGVSCSYSGAIADFAPATTLTKTGLGTQILAGANTYSGTTTVSAGKLFINGNQSSATGNVTVSANATFGGTGTLGGNTTIAAGGMLDFSLSTAPVSHDKLELAADKTLSFGANATLTISSVSGATTGDYTLISAPGGIGALPTFTLNLPAGWSASITRENSNIDLVLHVTSTGLDHFAISSIASPQTVGIAITGITITAQDAANQTATSFTGTVTFGGSAGVTGTSTNFVSGVLTGVSVTPENAGTNLILTVDDSSSHTGSATFTVCSAFDGWASGSGLTGLDAVYGANPDGDNFTNLQEFAFDMNPNRPVIAPLSYVPNGTATGGAPILEKSGSTYRAVFARRKDYQAAGLTYTVEFSADLANWPPNVQEPTVVAAEGSGPVDAVSVPFPDTVLLQGGDSAPPKFFRVKVTGN